MLQTLERGLRFDVEPGVGLPPLPGARLLEPRAFTTDYYDTPVLSLRRAGIALRRRVELGLPSWELDLPRNGGRVRLESPGGAGRPPDELAAIVMVHLRHGPLTSVTTLRTRRESLVVWRGARPLAEVALDAVDGADSHGAVRPFVQLVVEQHEGTEVELERLGRRLERSGARPCAGVPEPTQTPDIRRRRTDGSQATADRARVLLERQLLVFEQRDPLLRVGGDDEDVHQLRVATRRARAVIRASRNVFGAALAPLSEELRWLAGELAPVRDLDVLIDHLRVEARRLDVDAESAAELVDVLERERAEHGHRLAEAFASPRYCVLLCRFQHDIESLVPVAEGSVREVAAASSRRLTKAAARLPANPSDDELHALRITAKRARYAAELVAEGEKAVRSYLAALKALQDTIGEHQDAVVAESELRRIVSPTTAVAAGRLIEHERRRRTETRARYPKVLARALAAGRRAFG